MAAHPPSRDASAAPRRPLCSRLSRAFQASIRWHFAVLRLHYARTTSVARAHPTNSTSSISRRRRGESSSRVALSRYAGGETQRFPIPPGDARSTNDEEGKTRAGSSSFAHCSDDARLTSVGCATTLCPSSTRTFRRRLGGTNRTPISHGTGSSKTAAQGQYGNTPHPARQRLSIRLMPTERYAPGPRRRHGFARTGHRYVGYVLVERPHVRSSSVQQPVRRSLSIRFRANAG